MTFRFVLFLLLAMAALSTTARHASARQVDTDDLLYLEGVSWQVIEHSPQGLVFEIRNDSPGVPPATVSKLDAHTWLAAPPGARPVFEALELEWEVQWERTRETSLGLGDSSRAGETPIDFSLPRGHIIGDFRGVGLVSMRVGVAAAVYAAPPSYENGMAVLRRGRFAIRFEGGRLDEPPRATDLAQRDPYLVEMARATVLNHEQLPQLVREIRILADTHPVVVWNRQLAEAATRGPIALLHASSEGWHRIDRDALLAAGIDPSRWNPANLTALIGNETIPAHVATGPDGFEAISLWVPARERGGAEFVPVWLMDIRGARRLSAPPAVAAVGADGLPTITRTIFTPHLWSATYPALPHTSRWATASAFPGGDLRVRFDAPGLTHDGSATLTVFFGGNRANFSAVADMHLNGEPLAAGVEVTGNSPIEETFTLPVGLLRAEGNLLVATFEPGPLNVPQEELVLSRARVSYSSTTHLIPNATFTIADSAVDLELTADGPILDVTDPINPRWLGDDDELGPGRRVASIDPAQPVAFARVEPVNFSELIEPDGGADMIIITAEALREAAEEYAAYRRTGDRRVVLLTVEEIQRAFTYGWTTDGALRAAISHAFAAWPGARPRQILLIGEASEYWWQFDHPRDDVAPNQVPVHGYANPEMFIRGDDGHVITGGRIADLEIGRIPAQTPEEVRTALALVRAYETSAPGGAWRDQHLIVADDEQEFTRVAERLAVGSLFSRTEARRLYLHEFPYEDYFRIFQRKRSITASQALIDSLSQGALTATYIGHGGPNLWSPRRLFHMRDIPRVANGLRRPLLLAGSCDTAWLDFPVEPVRRSLAERFVLAPDGGAIASYAPVAGAVSHEHDYLLRAFYDAMLDHPDWEVGRLALASKLGYLLFRQDHGIPAQYVLLGDPALRLAQPQESALRLEVEATDLHVHQIPTIQVRCDIAELSDAEGTVWLEDRTGRPVSLPRSVRVRDGRFAAGLAFAQPLPIGDYAVVARITDADGNVHRAQHRLRVAPLPAEIEWTRAHIADDGATAHMEARASVSAPQTYLAVVLEVRHQSARGDQTLATLPMKPGLQAAWFQPIELHEGINVFTARVIADPQGPNRHILRESVREIPRPSDEQPILDLLPGTITAEPNPVEGITTITLRLINLTDEDLRNVGAELFVIDGESARRLGHFPRGFAAPPVGPVSLAWRATEVLPPGNHRARLRMVARNGENGDEDTVSTRDFTLQIPEKPRLEVIPRSVTARGDGGFRGETVFVTARVRNAGTTPLNNAIARLYLGWPHDGGVPAPSSVGESEFALRGVLAPGEEREVRLRWDPSPGSPAQAELVVVAGTTNRPADHFGESARAGVTVTQRDLPNLALLREEMRLSRDFVRPGDVLSIQIPFVNDTTEDFDFPFLVEVRAQGPQVEDTVILQHEMPRLAAGERVDLPITWRADGQRTRILAVVNEEREFGERRGDDNEARRDIAYLLPEQNLATQSGAWTFAPDRHLGTHANTMIDSGDAITIARRPTGGTARTFDNSMVIGDPIPLHGPGTNTDGLMALADGALYWTINETPQPVRLRVPLPEGRSTDVVDVYLTQLGPGYVNIDQSNSYHVRFNDGEWIANPNRREVEVYFGRFHGADGALTLEIANDGDPTWNTISQIRMVPVSGTYTSPIYEMERFPGGTFAPRIEAPTGSTVRFEFRTASQASLEPEFTNWGDVRPGLRLPTDPGIRILQWRVHLGAGPLVTPRVHDAVFEFAP